MHTVLQCTFFFIENLVYNVYALKNVIAAISESPSQVPGKKSHIPREELL